MNVGLPSPVAGSIVETNKALEINPELANQDPYENGLAGGVEADGLGTRCAQAYSTQTRISISCRPKLMRS